MILAPITPQSNDERLAEWAWRYFSAGYHREVPANDDNDNPPPMAA